MRAVASIPSFFITAEVVPSMTFLENIVPNSLEPLDEKAITQEFFVIRE